MKTQENKERLTMNTSKMKNKETVSQPANFGNVCAVTVLINFLLTHIYFVEYHIE